MDDSEEKGIGKPIPPSGLPSDDGGLKEILSEMTKTISAYRDICHESPISEADIQSIERSLTNLVAIALWHHEQGRNKEMRDVLLVVEEGRSLLAFNWYMHGSIKPAAGAKNLLPGPDSARKNEKGRQDKWE